MKKLECLECHVGENGGYSIVHNYKRAPVKGMGGSIHMGGGEREEHHFGPGQDRQVMTHISKALGLKNAKVQGASEEDGA